VALQPPRATLPATTTAPGPRLALRCPPGHRDPAPAPRCSLPPPLPCPLRPLPALACLGRISGAPRLPSLPARPSSLPRSLPTHSSSLPCSLPAHLLAPLFPPTHSSSLPCSLLPTRPRSPVPSCPPVLAPLFPSCPPVLAPHCPSLSAPLCRLVPIPPSMLTRRCFPVPFHAHSSLLPCSLPCPLLPASPSCPLLPASPSCPLLPLPLPFPARSSRSPFPFLPTPPAPPPRPTPLLPQPSTAHATSLQPSLHRHPPASPTGPRHASQTPPSSVPGHHSHLPASTRPPHHPHSPNPTSSPTPFPGSPDRPAIPGCATLAARHPGCATLRPPPRMRHTHRPHRLASVSFQPIHRAEGRLAFSPSDA
jgi:hypothetical protein